MIQHYSTSGPGGAGPPRRPCPAASPHPGPGSARQVARAPGTPSLPTKSIPTKTP